jgi:hypothetical protein
VLDIASVSGVADRLTGASRRRGEPGAQCSRSPHPAHTTR